MFSFLVAGYESHSADQLVLSKNQHRAHVWDKLQLNPALTRSLGLFEDFISYLSTLLNQCSK